MFMRSYLKEISPYVIAFLIITFVELVFDLGMNMYYVLIFTVGFFALMFTEKIRREHKKQWAHPMAAIIFGLIVILIATAYNNIV
ncbi:hypothetical protein GLW00_06915 [Halobacillus litoralis]|uniref:Uncharacterized protein n=1 Tax=Halobacillus litoralis TaxID=45668 RepID=A0A845F8C0_9BACI|nr:hypothetical protein [Halobacillus litoralis]MYL70572.1 hypothetical protein [Halobacillus litoralis]